MVIQALFPSFVLVETFFFDSFFLNDEEWEVLRKHGGKINQMKRITKNGGNNNKKQRRKNET
jgi:hypothetical protein